MEVIPSIIADNFDEIKKKISLVDDLVNWVEIDVVDGVFAPNLTWPNKMRQAPDELKEVGGKTKISAHLMVESPETIVEDWSELVDRIVVHYEATRDFDKIIETAGSHVGLAIALELTTPVEKIYEYLHTIKTVQFMSIGKIGFSGEKFNEHVFNKINTLKTNWPDVKIIVDGGIDLEITKRLKEVGVNGLVIGSQIWNAKNIEQTIKDFQNL